jgi:hypothetical protein
MPGSRVHRRLLLGQKPNHEILLFPRDRFFSQRGGRHSRSDRLGLLPEMAFEIVLPAFAAGATVKSCFSSSYLF